MKDWLHDRMQERSTWVGLVSLFSALGIALNPDQAEAFIAAGIAVAGLIAATTRG